VLREILDSTRTEDANTTYKKVRDFLVRFPGSGPEIKYVYERHLDRKFGIDELAPNILFVFSKRTFFWVDGQESYFPVDDELSFEARENIFANFDVIASIGDQFIVARFRPATISQNKVD